MLSPWKTASQTTLARLARWDDSPYPRFYYFNEHVGHITHQHMTYGEYSQLPESRLGYFEAAFTRNPYDKCWSGFLELQRDLARQPSRTYPEPWIRELVMRQLAENRAQLEAANYGFDEWLALLREEQVLEAGKNTSLPLHPAHYWTHHRGELAVNFVGRVENFEHDFEDLVRKLNIEPGSKESVNVTSNENLPTVPHPNGYRYVERMSARSIHKINQLFAADFELLGYERLTVGSVA